MSIQSKTQNLGDESNKGQIRISYLPGEIQNIAKVIGLKSVLNLVAQYGGDSIYIPKYEAITRAVRNMVIFKEFDGTNHKELARKYNITTRHIRIILKKLTESAKGESIGRKKSVDTD